MRLLRACSSRCAEESRVANVGGASAPAPAVVRVVPVAVPKAGIAFTVTEQAAFEAALKSISKDAPTRWDEIAAAVKTKTKAECIARYKAIREEVQRARK
jgi:hypothetical protein